MLRIIHLEIWVRRAVPMMVALFAGALVAISIVMTRDSYDRALSDAFTDLELVAGATTSNLDTEFREQPKIDLAAALAQAVPSRALARGQQVIVTDATGTIAGAAPASSGSNSTLNDYLGPSQPLTIFAEKAVSRASTSPTARTPSRPCARSRRRWADRLLYPTDVVDPRRMGSGEFSCRRAPRHDRSRPDRVRRRLLLLAGVARPRVQSHSANGTRSDRHGARPRTLRAVGLGSRARPDLLVGFDVKNPRHERPPAISVVRRHQHAGASARWRPCRDRRNADRRRKREPSTTLSGCTMSRANGFGCGRAPNSSANGREQPPHLVGIAVDITEQKALAERTATADLRLRDAIETVRKPSCSGTPTTGS